MKAGRILWLILYHSSNLSSLEDQGLEFSQGTWRSRPAQRKLLCQESITTLAPEEVYKCSQVVENNWSEIVPYTVG